MTHKISHHAFSFAAAVLVWAAAACTKEDVGRCCEVLPGSDMTKIPQPDPNDLGPNGEPRDIIRIDPDFDCEFLTCVSFQGSQAFCTKGCEYNDGCPEGFECAQVIESDPGPGSNLGPMDKFCVRKQTECLKD